MNSTHHMVGQVFWVSSFFKTRSESCSTRIRAFALIPCMEYDVAFPSIFVNSFILGFVEDGSSCGTHSAAFFRDCSFFQGFVLRSRLHHLSVLRRISLHLQHLRMMLWPQWVLYVHLPWSRHGSSPWFSIPIVRESQLACLLNQRYVLF